MDPDGDEAWDSTPTALEAARYTEALRQAADADARRKAVESEAARIVFGECLLKLTQLNVPEKQARAMLGKWRGKAKDDALLKRIIDHAHKTAVPEAISYVTKAIDKALARTSEVQDVMKGRWQELGWEAPRMTASGPRFRATVRGKVWRDPFGKLKVLPAEEGTVPPTLDDEPGVEVNG
jgi:hypothetical protein